ncbi:uncharacterized protein BO95DRAFT_25028 [Aspergillus brunneoviolaceus CBS 621.78]|uniref:Uncharacterized protein n=1 Tax=Aspergillus brunneoviolaceus CBS 621.78 TaxID=1450534 RepID=A0ACD1GIY0_9EURO|nr:hypothetical protein BO95DRAFT_25028 [Aspergillus brunneoviolaceus CBS 621.78]RAH49036.1 hypothetical protein BO95DRAFT_25028 [Aspergillus brunneoviolaceus CBS 621.78]
MWPEDNFCIGSINFVPVCAVRVFYGFFFNSYIHHSHEPQKRRSNLIKFSTGVHSVGKKSLSGRYLLRNECLRLEAVENRERCHSYVRCRPFFFFFLTLSLSLLLPFPLLGSTIQVSNNSIHSCRWNRAKGE